MSGKNNVNPDQYKVAGRDRQDDIARARRETSPIGKPRRKKGVPAPKLIPGAAPGGRAPEPDPARGDDADRR